MSNMLILHLAVVLIIGAAMGLLTRHLQPGEQPMDLSWSLVSGIIGAVAVSLLGAQIGIYEIGDFMYYATAPTGALIALMIYNVIIAKE